VTDVRKYDHISGPRKRREDTFKQTQVMLLKQSNYDIQSDVQGMEQSNCYIQSDIIGVEL
jgi:hypothetical protein